MYLISFFVSQYAIAQKVTVVKISDLNDKGIIPNASLRLVKTEDYNSVFTFGFTNVNGISAFNLAEKECCIIATCFNYFDTVICTKIIPGDTILILLRKRVTDLAPVIINTKIIYSKISKDTISYNLQSVTDGSEKNVGEALQKLPGISIDKNGKVFYQGRKVDQVKVEGNNVFGKMQQLVTENIDAGAVSKVDIYRQKSESAFGGEKLILDLRLNSKYKNKIIANFKINGGILNKYSGNLNAFKFKKNASFSFVNSMNNVGNSPLTLDDYLEITSGNNDEDNSQLGSQQSRVINSNELPKFLFSDNKIQLSKNIFSALSIIDSIKRFTKIQIFALAHLPNQKEQNISEYLNLVTLQKTFENTSKKNQLPLFLVDANSNTTLSPKIKMLLSLKLSNSQENNNAEFVSSLQGRYLNTNSVINKKVLTLNTNVTLQKNITEFSSISAYAKYSINNQKRNVNLLSNQPLYQEVILSSNNRIILENQFNTVELQSGINYGTKKKFPLYVNINFKKENNQNRSLNDIVTQNVFSLSSSNSRQSISESFSSSRNLFNKVSFNISGTAYQYFSSFNGSPVQKSFNNLLDYRSGISYFTKRLNQINLNINKTSTMPFLTSIYKNIFIESYRELYDNSLLINTIPNIEKNLSIAYISVRALKAKNSSISFTLINGKGKIVIDPLIYSNYIVNRSYYIPNYRGYMTYLNDDRQLLRQTLISKINITAYHIQNNYYFRGVKTSTRFSLLTFRNSLISIFPNSKLQMDITNDIKITQFTFNNTTIKLNELQPSITLKWNEKKCFYELNIKKLYQFSNYFQSSTILNIGYMVRKKIKNKYEISATGDNILNLNSPNLLNIGQNNGLQTLSKIKILPGYILVGFRYNF